MMRKRKRGQGVYFDDETGDSASFQTTKSAKRAYQRTGKWYKEPTERELRIWDREEAQRDAAEKANKREQNKKASAAKRAEKEARELELKQKMFSEGKITFTQTLAKKDEDQLNLHDWFGGRKHVDTKNKKKNLPPVPKFDDKSESESKNSDLGDRRGGSSPKSKIDDLISEDLEAFSPEDFGQFDIAQPQANIRNMVIADSPDSIEVGDKFHVLEDSSAGDLPSEVLQDIHDNEQDSASQPIYQATFPARKRLPLSPLSHFDLNTRASLVPEASCFYARIEEGKRSVTSVEPSVVQDLLSGLSTQDLDIDDDIANMEKENRDPVKNKPTNKVDLEPFEKGATTTAKLGSASKATTVSFGDSNTDYDSIFAELDHTATVQAGVFGEYVDNELDDETLMSIQASQTGLSAGKSADPSKEPKETKGIISGDSFAVEGLSDNDLLAGLDDYERSQKSHRAKKRRPLPWDRPEWHEVCHEQLLTADEVSASQCTELLDE